MKVNKRREVEPVEEFDEQENAVSDDTSEVLDELSEHLSALRALVDSLEESGLDGVASKVANIADDLETTLESIEEY